MHSLKVFSVLILALFSLVEASESSKKSLKKIRKIKGKEPADKTTAGEGERTSSVVKKSSDDESEMSEGEKERWNQFYQSIGVDKKYIPDASSSSEYKCTMAWDKFLEEADKERIEKRNYPSPQYLAMLRGDPNAHYYPLEIDEAELEDQVNPTRNIGARVMARYRSDMGLQPLVDIQNYASEQRILELISFFHDRPSFVWYEDENESRRTEIVNQFRSLQDFGVISEDLSGMNSREVFFEATGLNSLKNMNEVYKKLSSKYFVIDWHLLDLTPFHEQFFPYEDQRFMGKFPYVQRHKKKVKKFVTDLVFSINGTRLLEENIDHIRFHNPETLEGSRMLLFQRLYRRYHKKCSKHNRTCDPSRIDWSQTYFPSNWPEDMSHIDMTSWTAEQIETMNKLIDEQMIKFEYHKFDDVTEYLGPPEPIDPQSLIRVRADEPEGTIRALSDNEDACGKPASLEAKYLYEELDAARDQEDKERAKAAKLKAKQKTLEKKKKQLQQQRQLASKKRQSKDEEDEDNEEEEAELTFDEPKEVLMMDVVDDNSDDSDFECESDGSISGKKPRAKASPSKSKAAQKSSSKSLKSPMKVQKDHSMGFTDVINVKDNSKNLASPADRQKAYAEALNVYRQKTGDADAREIDWSLMNVRRLQNHLIPFSLSLRTEGDIKTLLNLIRRKDLEFYDLKRLSGRKVQLYNRIYDQLYGRACGQFRHPFDIKWSDFDIKGWPVGVLKAFNRFTEEQVNLVNGLLDEEAITSTPSKGLLEEIEKVVEEDKREIYYAVPPADPFPAYVPSEADSYSGPPSVDEDDESVDDLHSNLRQKKSRSKFIGKRRKLIPSFEGEVESPFVTPNSTATSNKTPNFSSIMRAKTPARTPKRSHASFLKTDSSEDVMDFDENLLIGSGAGSGSIGGDDGRGDDGDDVAFKRRKVVEGGSFAGANEGIVDQVLAEIRASIAGYTAAKAQAWSQPRFPRVFSEIIRCLTLLAEHRDSRPNSRCHLIPVSDLRGYLETFLRVLLRLQMAPNHDLDAEMALRFNATRFEFRARLAGASYSRVTGVLTVTNSNLRVNNSSGFFSAFVGSHRDWNPDVLASAELLLDDSDDMQLFKEPKVRR